MEVLGETGALSDLAQRLFHMSRLVDVHRGKGSNIEATCRMLPLGRAVRYIDQYNLIRKIRFR